MLKQLENLDNSLEIFLNDYYEAKEYAKAHNLIEAEYGDTGYMYNDEPISYVCYNKTGNQDGDYVLTAYYTWKIDEETGRLKPSPIDEERLNRLIMY